MSLILQWLQLTCPCGVKTNEVACFEATFIGAQIYRVYVKYYTKCQTGMLATVLNASLDMLALIRARLAQHSNQWKMPIFCAFNIKASDVWDEVHPCSSTWHGAWGSTYDWAAHCGRIRMSCPLFNTNVVVERTLPDFGGAGRRVSGLGGLAPFPARTTTTTSKLKHMV